MDKFNRYSKIYPQNCSALKINMKTNRINICLLFKKGHMLGKHKNMFTCRILKKKRIDTTSKLW